MTDTIATILAPIITANQPAWELELDVYNSNPHDRQSFTESFLNQPATPETIISLLHILGHLDSSAFRLVRNRQPPVTDTILTSVSSRCMAQLINHVKTHFPADLDHILNEAAICHHTLPSHHTADLIRNLANTFPGWKDAILSLVTDNTPLPEEYTMRQSIQTNLYQIVEIDESYLETLLSYGENIADIHKNTLAIMMATSGILFTELGPQTLALRLTPIAAFYLLTQPAQERPLPEDTRQAIEALWKLIDEKPEAPEQYSRHIPQISTPSRLAEFLQQIDTALESDHIYIRETLQSNKLDEALWTPFHIVLSQPEDSLLAILNKADHNTLKPYLTTTRRIALKQLSELLRSPLAIFLLRYIAARLHLTAYYPTSRLHSNLMSSSLTPLHFIILHLRRDTAPTKDSSFLKQLWTILLSTLTLTTDELTYIRECNYTYLVATRITTTSELLITFRALHPDTAAAILPQFTKDLTFKAIGRNYLTIAESVPYDKMIPVELNNLAYNIRGTSQYGDTELTQLIRSALVPLVEYSNQLYAHTLNPIDSVLTTLAGYTQTTCNDNGPYQTYIEHLDEYYYLYSSDQAALLNWLLRNPQNYAHFYATDRIAPTTYDPEGLLRAVLLHRTLKRIYKGNLPSIQQTALVIKLLSTITSEDAFIAQAKQYLHTTLNLYLPLLRIRHQYMSTDMSFSDHPLSLNDQKGLIELILDDEDFDDDDEDFDDEDFDDEDFDDDDFDDDDFDFNDEEE